MYKGSYAASSQKNWKDISIIRWSSFSFTFRSFVLWFARSGEKNLERTTRSRIRDDVCATVLVLTHRQMAHVGGESEMAQCKNNKTKQNRTENRIFFFEPNQTEAWYFVCYTSAREIWEPTMKANTRTRMRMKKNKNTNTHQNQRCWCFYCLSCRWCDAVAFLVVFIVLFVYDVVPECDGLYARKRCKAKQVIKTTDGHRMKNVNRIAWQPEWDETNTLKRWISVGSERVLYGWREHVNTWINVLAHIRQRRSINASVIGRKAIDEESMFDRFLWVCEKCLKRQKSAIKCIKKR